MTSTKVQHIMHYVASSTALLVRRKGYQVIDILCSHAGLVGKLFESAEKMMGENSAWQAFILSDMERNIITGDDVTVYAARILVRLHLHTLRNAKSASHSGPFVPGEEISNGPSFHVYPCPL